MIAASLLLIAGAATLLVIGLWQASSALLGASIAASVLAAVTLIVGTRRTAAMLPGAPSAAPAAPEPALVSAPPASSAPPSAPRFGAGAGFGAGTAEDDTQPLPAVVGAASGSDDPPDHPDSAYQEHAEDAGADRLNESFESGTETGEDEASQTSTRAAFGDTPTATIPAQPAGGSPSRLARGASAEPQPGSGSAPQAEPEPEPPFVDSAGRPSADSTGPGDNAEVLEDEDPPDEPLPQRVSAADAARVGRMLTEVLVVDGRPRYHLPGCVHLLGRESEPLPVGEAIELGFTPCSLCEPDSALLADARRV